MKTRYLTAASMISLICVLAPAAHAQSTDSGAQIAEIVVTAQKKSESLQRAALAVHAMRADDLDKAGIKNGFDLQYIDPAIKVIPSIEPNVAIRGLGTPNFNPGVDPSVAFNEDGIYLSSPNALSPVLYDIERVEAVLGPQGTLYGRNSNGGTINFITQIPQMEAGGYIKAGAGNFSALSAEAAVNFPLSDKAAIRIAGASDKHSGYNSDGSNNLNAFAGRAKILLQPSDRFRIILTGDTSRKTMFASSYDGICPPELPNVPACTGVPVIKWSGLLPQRHAGSGSTIVYGAGLQADLDLGWSKLISLTGYKDTNWKSLTSAPWYNSVNNFDFIENLHDKFFSQEVRLSSANGAKTSWVGGIYFSSLSQSGGSQQNYYTNTFVQTSGGPENFYQAFREKSSKAQSFAVFGDVTVPVGLLDGLSFVAGARYTHEYKGVSGLVESGITSPHEVFPGAIETNSSVVVNRVTWKAGIKYQATPTNLFYFTASTGFKSGGINILPNEAGRLVSYDPEYITSFEVGTKNTLLSGRMQVNASLFHYDYKNYQAYVFWRPNDSAPERIRNGTFFPIVNSQSATFQGGEASVRWKATAHDTFGASLSILDNTFDKYVLDLPYFGTLDFSHTPVPQSPRSTWRLDYEHSFELGGGNVLSVGWSTEFASSQIAQGTYVDGNGDTVLYRTPKYHRSNASLSYRNAELGLTIDAFARNIENKAVVNSLSSGYPIPENFLQVNYRLDAPRTYGISVKKAF